MDEDDRLMPILSHLSLSFLTNISATDNNFFGENDPDSEKVTADMVDALASKHFPACQYNLWRRLKRDRHLKHYGRLQFGLFLKVSFSRRGQGLAARWILTDSRLSYRRWGCPWKRL